MATPATTRTASTSTDPGTGASTKPAKKGKFTAKQKAAAGGAAALAVIVAVVLKERSASSSNSSAATPAATTATPTYSSGGETQSGDIGSIEAQIAALEGEFAALGGTTSTSTPPPGTTTTPPATGSGTTPPSTTDTTTGSAVASQAPAGSALANLESTDPTAPVLTQSLTAAQAASLGDSPAATGVADTIPASEAQAIAAFDANPSAANAAALQVYEGSAP